MTHSHTKRQRATTKRHKTVEQKCEELKRESSKDKILQRDAKQPQRHKNKHILQSQPRDLHNYNHTFRWAAFCRFEI